MPTYVKAARNSELCRGRCLAPAACGVFTAVAQSRVGEHMHVFVSLLGEKQGKAPEGVKPQSKFTCS